MTFRGRYAAPMASYVLAASACASSGSAGSGVCRSDLEPSPRTLREVVDSAVAQRRLEALWPQASGLTVASLGGVTDPDSDAITIWSESLPEEQTTELERLLASTTVMPLQTSERAYLVIGDDRGPAIRRVDRLAQCPPRIFGRSYLTRRIESEARGLRLDRPVVVRLNVFVETSGRSGEVRIAESSGDFAIDRAAARVFDGVDFVPAQVEGIPIAVWASFPVTFTPR